ncbi:hypothetical protein FB446DRAFT_789893 [Lentinula raphanica]|nr:hypothetical protein FB446DRAFT_789893 [Lentinula raphanica]
MLFVYLGHRGLSFNAVLPALFVLVVAVYTSATPVPADSSTAGEIIAWMNFDPPTKPSLVGSSEEFKKALPKDYYELRTALDISSRLNDQTHLRTNYINLFLATAKILEAEYAIPALRRPINYRTKARGPTYPKPSYTSNSKGVPQRYFIDSEVDLASMTLRSSLVIQPGSEVGSVSAVFFYIASIGKVGKDGHFIVDKELTSDIWNDLGKPPLPVAKPTGLPGNQVISYRSASDERA